MTDDEFDLHNGEKPPPRKLPKGQVWAWMHGPGRPHWEVRGTGAIVPEHLKRRPDDGS